MNKDKRCITCANNGVGTVFCHVCDDGDMYKKRPQIVPTDYAQYSRRTTLPITNVIFAPPATIVFWNDGTKTVVKCENEVYDPEKGLAMAISKRALGNKGNYFETFKKWVDPYVEKQAEKELKKDDPWYVWRMRNGECVGRRVKAYKRKCDASRVANKLNSLENSDMKYVVSQTQPTDYEF